MPSTAGLHSRHRRLRGADFLDTLRLGQCLIGAGFLKVIQDERTHQLGFQIRLSHRRCREPWFAIAYVSASFHSFMRLQCLHIISSATQTSQRSLRMRHAQIGTKLPRAIRAMKVPGQNACWQCEYIGLQAFIVVFDFPTHCGNIAHL